MNRATPASAATLVIAILFASGCVPTPVGQASASAGPSPTPSPTPVPTPAGPTPTPSFVRPTPTPEPTFMVYTVVRGDTLVGIGRRFRTSGRSVAYWNRATYPSLDPDSPTYSPNLIEVGWMLRLIPGVEVDPENLPPAAGPSAAATPSSTPEPSDPVLTPEP